MTLAMAIYRAAGLPMVHIERELGAFLTGNTGLRSWILGLLWHLLNGGVFALIYAAGFRSIGRAGVGLGLLFGIVHWYLAGYLLGALPMWRVTVQYGGLAAIFVFVLHLIFGMIVGANCGGAMTREAEAARESSELEEREEAA
jgi:hypothetical protein